MFSTTSFSNSTTSFVGPLVPPTPAIWEPHAGNPIELVFGLSQIIITILQCKLIISSIRIHRSQSNQKKKTKPHALRIAIVIFTAYLISSIFGIVQSILYFIDASDVASAMINVHSVLQSVLIIALYAFMALRVHQTFSDTIYRASNITLIIHSINIFCVSVGVFFFAAILLREELSSWIKIIFIMFVLAPFVIGLAHLIYMFNARLFSLFLLKRSGADSSINGLTTSQRRLLNTVRKHTVLGAFIVMAQLVTLIHTVLLYGVIDLYSTAGYVSYWVVCNLCIIVETVCLFLGFTDNGATYLNICGHFDGGCDRICVRCVQKHHAPSISMVSSITVSSMNTASSIVKDSSAGGTVSNSGRGVED